MKDFSKPRVVDEGWGLCPYCMEYKYLLKLQDIWTVKHKGTTVFVPTLYFLCECLEIWFVWRKGDYDDLLGLYMIRGKL
jgi:hypothetical protein